MFFKDNSHKEYFFKLVTKNHKERDREYPAAYYVLTCEEEMRSKTLGSIKDDGDGICWDKILENDFSHGYNLLVQLALHLFSVDLVDMINTLNADNYDVITQAIAIRRYGGLYSVKEMAHAF